MPRRCHRHLMQMCILAGCDFVKPLPGIGIKKAHQIIRRLGGFVKVCGCGHLSYLLGVRAAIGVLEIIGSVRHAAPSEPPQADVCIHE
jgi:5'-3' exonuclease